MNIKTLIILTIILINGNVYGTKTNDSLLNLNINSVDTSLILNYGNNKSFNDFWIAFRKAIIDSNYTFIKSHTVFPLMTQGPLHYDKIIKLEDDKFKILFKAYLNQDSGNTIDFVETEFDYIIKTNDIFCQHLNKHSHFKANSEARIGGMLFRFVDNNWFLYFIYIHYETYDKLGIEY